MWNVAGPPRFFNSKLQQQKEQKEQKEREEKAAAEAKAAAGTWLSPPSNERSPTSGEMR